MSDPIEEIQEPVNRWFQDNENNVFCGDIEYQKRKDPIKEGDPEKYTPIPIRPDLPHIEFDGTEWVDDPELKQATIDSFVNQSMKQFMKTIYSNFDTLPAGMKTMLTAWKKDIDDFKDGL